MGTPNTGIPRARRKLLSAVAFAAIALHLPVLAQRRFWRIGYHSGGSAESNAGWLDAFRKGMDELGRSEARDYVIDARYADGDPAATQRIAAELVATQGRQSRDRRRGSLYFQRLPAREEKVSRLPAFSA